MPLMVVMNTMLKYSIDYLSATRYRLKIPKDTGVLIVIGF
ncbi:hypothetical protein SP119_1163 [Streptococcus pyogenes]|uniref:Uncharacterized protein n=2 Tax=Streptococcus pyogenes TaxID=1314 RepID=A0ABD7UUJ0_STRPY|nr:hypothetical protein MGAS9429_Spy1210 [Streptococcus pyogenes MGAS9429]AEQ24757.1 hypothetical protein SPYALAB49_001160 [Streptococcus pyogenes Alab49]AFV38278.1 hypothetical protein A20_1196c [Streptococcus pyogenes A20]AGQ28569.1 hypothetical protein L897_05775 [Streptococcus pyogenes HSC5]AIG50571.1 hypothetical protein STAB901_06080 [Streptococcus pyogenes STAB901]AIQ01246.1 hypothetical protein FE90_0477 [Streptococcus pyogenes]EIK41667.1 hypothetical protein SPYOHK_03645 [Streptococc